MTRFKLTNSSLSVIRSQPTPDPRSIERDLNTRMLAAAMQKLREKSEPDRPAMRCRHEIGELHAVSNVVDVVDYE